ncbi:MAG: hypothetical protein L6R35_003814 [Caloplaca aegaea]|nr:MAG: hypothetical protein L6R35_003814 [Caloplaca aegaea]
MDGVSIAGSLVSIGAAGCQIAVKLYTLATQIITASERVSSISNDIFLTSGVLQQLGELLTQKTDTDGTTIFTQSSLDITKTSASICERIFNEVEKALKDASEQIRDRGRLVGKIKLSRSEKAKWPFAQPSIEALRNHLREAKGTLMLMLQVTSLALSKKMANDIHAILELSKQHNVMTRARVPVASSRNGSPEPASPTARARINRTMDENLVPRQTAASRYDVALSIGPNFEVLERSPRVTFSRSQEVPTDERSPSADSRYRAPSAIRERCDQDEVVVEADCISNAGLRGGSISTTVEWNTDNGRGRKLLDFFILKPIIQDLVDVIQLSWRIHKIPMQQAEVQKQMVEAEHGGVLATFQLYQDLYAHEHKAIDHEIAKAGAGASLTSIKRTTANLWHRDIFFKGVPGLQFVLEHFPLLAMTAHGMPEKSGDQAQNFVSQPQKATELPMEPLVYDPSEGQEDEMYETIVPALEQVPTRARNSIELPYSPSPSMRDYRRAPSSNGTSSASSLHENRITALGDCLSRMEGPINWEAIPYLVSLRRANFIVAFEVVSYPTGILRPTACMDNARSASKPHYSIQFLIQFRYIASQTLVQPVLDQLICKINATAIYAQRLAADNLPEPYDIAQPIPNGKRTTRASITFPQNAHQYDVDQDEECPGQAARSNSSKSSSDLPQNEALNRPATLSANALNTPEEVPLMFGTKDSVQGHESTSVSNGNKVATYGRRMDNSVSGIIDLQLRTASEAAVDEIRSSVGLQKDLGTDWNGELRAQDSAYFAEPLRSRSADAAFDFLPNLERSREGGESKIEVTGTLNMENDFNPDEDPREGLEEGSKEEPDDKTGEGAGEEISEELADTAEAHVGDDVELAIVHRRSDKTENGHSGGLEDSLEVTQHRTHLQQGRQLAQHSIILGHGLAVARPDFQLYNYLWRHNVISDAVYQDIKGDGRQMDVLALKDLLGEYTTLYNGPGSEGA